MSPRTGDAAPIAKSVVDDSATVLIGGKWMETGATFPVLDPATSKVISRPASGGPAQAVAALDAAHAAFPGWSKTPAERRGECLRQAADAIRAASESLARLLSAESGKPLAEARNELLGSTKMLEWAAEQGRRVDGRIASPGPTGLGMVLLEPVGVTLAITPWNFPAVIVARKLGLALAAGVTVILKPAEQTPLTAVAFARILQNAGLPPGVLNLVTCDEPMPVVQLLMSDSRLRKVTFTGSTKVGRALAKDCGDHLRRISLELGGHAPAIVFPDADLELAADSIIRAKFANAGQACTAINRLFIHRDVHDALLEMLVARVSAFRLGHGWDPQVTMGPLIDSAGLEKVERHVADAVRGGAAIIAGGRPWIPDDPHLRGAFYEPTILTGVSDRMLVSREETFGPVLPILQFDDRQDIVERANDTAYGLVAYVFTNGIHLLWRSITALNYGVIGVNEGAPIRPELPFGGMKDSGQDREGGVEGIHAYLEAKSVTVRVS